MTPKTTLHLTIHGRVQGVNYRDSMRREAERLGVAGWVRNRDDGTVEAMVQGKAGAVDAILGWAHQGPEYARVDRVDTGPGNGAYSSFEIHY